jgi:hypothetical protein
MLAHFFKEVRYRWSRTGRSGGLPFSRLETFELTAWGALISFAFAVVLTRILVGYENIYESAYTLLVSGGLCGIFIGVAVYFYRVVTTRRFFIHEAERRAEKALQKYRAAVVLGQDPAKRKVWRPKRILIRDFCKGDKAYFLWPESVFSFWKKWGVILVTAHESFAGELHPHDRLKFIGVKVLWTRRYYWGTVPVLCMHNQIIRPNRDTVSFKEETTFWGEFRKTLQAGGNMLDSACGRSIDVSVEGFVGFARQFRGAWKDHEVDQQAERELRMFRANLPDGMGWSDVHDYLFHRNVFLERSEFSDIPSDYVRHLLGATNLNALESRVGLPGGLPAPNNLV